MDYTLLDSGNQKKMERFGPYTLVRPCNQALWRPSLSEEEWKKADAHFTREEDGGWAGSLPKTWVITHKGIKFTLSPTEFGHLGIFPEHSILWEWAAKLVQKRGEVEVINLFAYSGGASLALAKAGAAVCHVDASHGMVQWARENAALNGLEEKPIRWIVDDAIKFLKREIRRGRRYDGILLDPPSFGRGAKGEVFKIERDIGLLLSLCKDLLSDEPLFCACSNHTSAITPMGSGYLLEDALGEKAETGELFLEGPRNVPTGSYARWSC
ncbi:MAG: Ribosomal RNA large subunit methyltransferase K [Chlamydiae bacterium]|nr:Ribosomal RNA large subunit methyltransferase K [Chlamydiota bacterium]